MTSDEKFNRIMKIIDEQMAIVKKHQHLLNINNMLDDNDIEIL